MTSAFASRHGRTALRGLALAATALVALAAGRAALAEDLKPVKVTFIQHCCSGATFFQPMQFGAEEAARLFHVTLTYVNADGDAARHANTVVEKTAWVPEYYCRDPQAAGLHLAEFFTRAQPIVCGQGERNDAETADARAEAQRAERRKVLALNKLGLAAQEVRRAWVRDHLLARKAPVKGAAVFVATCLERGPGLLADHAGRQVIAELLSLGQASLRTPSPRWQRPPTPVPRCGCWAWCWPRWRDAPRRTRGVTRQATTSQCQGRPTTSHSWPPKAIRARPSSRCSPGTADVVYAELAHNA